VLIIIAKTITKREARPDFEARQEVPLQAKKSKENQESEKEL
jgi:hypothetical protein